MRILVELQRMSILAVRYRFSLANAPSRPEARE
jgi:hypothetical protein